MTFKDLGELQLDAEVWPSGGDMAQLTTGTTWDSRDERVTAREASAAPGSPISPSKIAIPKTTPLRLKGNAMRKFRFEIFMRDGQACVICGCKVSFNGKSSALPPMHLSHKRNKRMFGDIESNCETRCADCHMVGKHVQGDKGKIVPRKEVVA